LGEHKIPRTCTAPNDLLPITSMDSVLS
jgi:hypothetical protein